ncbi:alpha/beta-hydrolase [Aspergillus saccharolyticus JOP 1030-1]|uniref:Alpha/beta-hydrolase n=1 Tax=Aspergillus saccharolyticus JOP 1030-1 TaxID=1450539 RepID=A0A318ZEU7_9EURO|nr:alpha/beta-hydrolase [Aspergillus saccharolyticus JOP 1030-1]PYH45625.1 alpha/beta-hydrolase [Aspergillus saccharolyticus JOP 1030-1]
MGWRYQIPMLINMGLRVVAPDCLGYGQTDAPEDIHLYSHRNCANDIKELAAQLDAPQIILGGHDWGAALAYRVALWHPTLVTHVFTVCVPYSPPTRHFLSLEEFTRKIAPHFGYQLQFRSGALERALQSKERIARFLSALYGGLTVGGGDSVSDEGGGGGDADVDDEPAPAFDAEVGVLWDRLERVGASRLLSEEELEYYATEYARNGLRGPLNWYRTRRINYEDELSILNQRFTAPLLFIQALKDPALPPNLGGGMTRTIPHLTYKQVRTGHWALWQRPEEVNAIIAWWVEEVVFGRFGVSKL